MSDELGVKPVDQVEARQELQRHHVIVARARFTIASVICPAHLDEAVQATCEAGGIVHDLGRIAPAWADCAMCLGPQLPPELAELASRFFGT